jgi:hypothetical protein
MEANERELTALLTAEFAQVRFLWLRAVKRARFHQPMLLRASNAGQARPGRGNAEAEQLGQYHCTVAHPSIAQSPCARLHSPCAAGVWQELQNERILLQLQQMQITAVATSRNRTEDSNASAFGSSGALIAHVFRPGLVGRRCSTFVMRWCAGASKHTFRWIDKSQLELDFEDEGSILGEAACAWCLGVPISVSIHLFAQAPRVLCIKARCCCPRLLRPELAIPRALPQVRAFGLCPSACSI